MKRYVSEDINSIEVRTKKYIKDTLGKNFDTYIIYGKNFGYLHKNKLSFADLAKAVNDANKCVMVGNFSGGNEDISNKDVVTSAVMVITDLVEEFCMHNHKEAANIFEVAKDFEEMLEEEEKKK